MKKQAKKLSHLIGVGFLKDDRAALRLLILHCRIRFICLICLLELLLFHSELGCFKDFHY